MLNASSILFRRTLSITSRKGSQSHVSRGKEYEESCRQILCEIGISTRIVGGAMDGGVDLVGHWHFDESSPPSPVIVQCKNIKRACSPAPVRELEGTMAKWDKGAVGIFMCTQLASKATLDTLKQSHHPLLYIFFDKERVRKAFGNTSLQRVIPGLVIGSKHIDGQVEPTFFFTSTTP